MFQVFKKDELQVIADLCIKYDVMCTRGDQKVRGKVLLNRIAFIDCNENS